MKKSSNRVPEELPQNSSNTNKIITEPKEFFLRIRKMLFEELSRIFLGCSDGEKWKIVFEYQEPAKHEGRNTRQHTVLHRSCFNEDKRVFELLLKKWGEIYTSEEWPDYFRRADWAGNTLMHYAVIKNLDEAAKRLVSLGAPLDVFNSKFETPLRIAFREGQQETGHVLCDKLWEKKAFSASLPADLKKHYKDCEDYRSVLKMAVGKIFDVLSKDDSEELVCGEFFNFTKPFTNSITDKKDTSRIQTVIQLLMLSGQLSLIARRYEDAMRYTAAAASLHHQLFGENSEILHGHMMCILLSYLSEEAFPTKEGVPLVCTDINKNPILKLRQELDIIRSNREARTIDENAEALKKFFKRMCSKSKSTVCSILDITTESAPKFTILGTQEQMGGMFSLSHMELVLLTQDDVPSHLMMQKQSSTRHYYAAVLNMLYLFVSAMGDFDLREFCPNLSLTSLSKGSFDVQRGVVPVLFENDRARWERKRVGTVSELTASGESRALVSKAIRVYGDKRLHSELHDTLQKKPDDSKCTARLSQNQNRVERLEGGIQEAFSRLKEKITQNEMDMLFQNVLQLQAAYKKCLENVDFLQHDGEVPASMMTITRKELSLVDELLNMACVCMLIIGDNHRDEKTIKQMYRELQGGTVSPIDNKKLQWLLRSRYPAVKASIICLHTVRLLMKPRHDNEIEAWLSTCVKEIFKSTISTIEPHTDRERKEFFEHNVLVFQSMAKAFFPLLRKGGERKIDELFFRLINTSLEHVRTVIIRTLNHILHAEENHKGEGRLLMCALILRWVLICFKSEDTAIIKFARFLWKGVQPILTNVEKLNQLLRDSIVEPNGKQARVLEHLPDTLPGGPQKNMRFVDSRREGCHPTLFPPGATGKKAPIERLIDLRKRNRSIQKIAEEQNYKLEILKIEILILEVAKENFTEAQPDEQGYREALVALSKEVKNSREVYLSARVSGENPKQKERHLVDVEKCFEKYTSLRELSLAKVEDRLRQVRVQHDTLLQGGVVKVGEEFHCNNRQISQAEKECERKLAEHVATGSLTTDPENDEWVEVMSAPAI